ncbi:MAG TPA: phosphatidylserine decarboxylase family protein [Bacteroidales bacterium]|nr:phosphatidylserine decarboxylase family protein [Bacteroidales bacterium]
MKIHREGRKIIYVTGTAVIIANLLALASASGFIIIAVAVATLVYFAFTILFFRVPVRNNPGNEALIYSACDGQVVAIEEVMENEYFKDRRIQVSVFMSIFNVHVNFAPVSGEVVYLKYHPGKYYFAWMPKSSYMNEHNSLVIRQDSGKEILMRQIAGAVTRRIVCNPKMKESVNQCKEIGIIKFGSRIDLFFEPGCKILVKLNQKVTGAVTPIASIEEHHLH